MVRLGIPRPPGVAIGDRVVHGWNPEGYAALLGVDYRAAKRFAPAELASRLDRGLEWADDDEEPAQALGEMRGEAEAPLAAGDDDARVGFGVAGGVERAL